MLLKTLAAALAALAISASGTSAAPRPDLAPIVEEARGIDRLNALIVAHRGTPLVEEAVHGPPLDRAINIKSVSKTLISALVGIAIERGVFSGVDQTVGELLGEGMPEGADPAAAGITLADLLTMRAGLERTSGANYGPWIASRNWVDYALTRPMIDRPGGRMLYSTGSTHILSALLTRASGQSTAVLAREWLAEPLNISIPPWERDRQGIYLGGNNMAVSPRGLLAFGELYRNDGMHEGRRILPEGWVAASWQPRTESFFTGHGYGYAWFTTELADRTVHYGWGYGGQMLYVVPDLELTTVMTSDTDRAVRGDGHVDRLHGLMARIVERTANAHAQETGETGVAPEPLTR